MKSSELKEMIARVVQEAKQNGAVAKGGRRFIPQTIEFPKAIRDEFKEHFKLMKSGAGEYTLYMSPLMNAALGGINRGRTGSNYWKETPGLTIVVSEKIPGDVRGILKKYVDKLNPGLDMYSINLKIKEVTPDGTIVFPNPGSPNVDKEDYYTPNINEKKKKTIGSIDTMSKLVSSEGSLNEVEPLEAPEEIAEPLKTGGRPLEKDINIKSVIERIAEQIFGAKTADEAKKLFIEFIQSTKVNDKDKTKMISNVQSMTNLVKIQFYVANALLKYEGLGLSQLKSKDEPEGEAKKN